MPHPPYRNSLYRLSDHVVNRFLAPEIRNVPNSKQGRSPKPPNQDAVSNPKTTKPLYLHRLHQPRYQLFRPQALCGNSRLVSHAFQDVYHTHYRRCELPRAEIFYLRKTIKINKKGIHSCVCHFFLLILQRI